MKYISHRDQIPARRLDHPSLSGVTKQVLVGPDQGWDGHVLRMFTLDEGGYVPRHSHDWPHILYAVEGEGTLYMDGEDHPLTPGSTAFVPSNIEHQILNAGAAKFVFICIVPRAGDV